MCDNINAINLTKSSLQHYQENILILDMISLEIIVSMMIGNKIH